MFLWVDGLCVSVGGWLMCFRGQMANVFLWVDG